MNDENKLTLIFHKRVNEPSPFVICDVANTRKTDNTYSITKEEEGNKLNRIQISLRISIKKKFVIRGGFKKNVFGNDFEKGPRQIRFLQILVVHQ